MVLTMETTQIIWYEIEVNHGGDIWWHANISADTPEEVLRIFASWETPPENQYRLVRKTQTTEVLA